MQGDGDAGPDPAGAWHAWHVWQVALREGLVIAAVSGPGDSSLLA